MTQYKSISKTTLGEAADALRKLRIIRELHQCEGHDKNECTLCGVLDCKHGEPLHYHHDGCPACE
jgi:hypothetical protein